jgi:hypothetical protein
MSDREAGPQSDLGEGIAGILRVGTVVSVIVIAIGFIVAAMTGLPSRGARPLPDVVLRAGPDAPIAVGLFALTLLPLIVLAYAAIGFARAGERGRLTATLVVLGLLVAGLGVAAVLGRPS